MNKNMGKLSLFLAFVILIASALISQDKVGTAKLYYRTIKN